MIYWILIIIFLIIISIISYNLWKLSKRNKILIDEMIKDKKKPITIWFITKYSDKDIDLLLRNEEIIDLILRIYEFKIAKKTDSIRSLEQTELKVWHLNWLWEMHNFFHQLKLKLNKKEDKTWHDLV